MDKLRNIEVFVAVVEAGSFAEAARRLDISAVMVGKHVQQLETQLGARLLQRSTRRQSLTEVGRSFYEGGRQVLEQLHWAESAVERSRSAPQGLLRISAPLTLGNQVIAPLVADYQLANPLVQVELQLSDGLVDLVGDQIDVAVRIGPVGNEGLVARPLTPYRMVIAAAPAYVQRHGAPHSVADLAQHDCLSYAVWQLGSGWMLRDGATQTHWPQQARLRCNSGAALRQAALRGLGLILQPEVLLADDIASGRLVPVLQNCVPAPRPVNLVYLPDRQQLPKLRHFVEHMLQALDCRSGPDSGSR
jgi:DNA-binding transcriptional LysR family regulator